MFHKASGRAVVVLAFLFPFDVFGEIYDSPGRFSNCEPLVPFPRALNPASSTTWDLSFGASFAGGTTLLGRTFAWRHVFRFFGAHQKHLSRAIEVLLLLLHVRVGRVSSTRRKLPSFFFLTRRDPTKQTDAFATHRDEDLLSFPHRFLGGMGRVAALVPPGFRGPYMDRFGAVFHWKRTVRGPFLGVSRASVRGCGSTPRGCWLRRHPAQPEMGVSSPLGGGRWAMGKTRRWRGGEGKWTMRKRAWRRKPAPSPRSGENLSFRPRSCTGAKEFD